MATDPSVPFQFLAAGNAEAPKVQADFEAFLKYVRDRNDGTTAWDSFKMTGTTTNDSAATGIVGEYVESVTSGTAYTSATYTNIASISLTAGDWDVTGIVVGQGGSTSTNGPNVTITSLFSGATTTDHVIAENMQYWAGAPVASVSAGGSLPLWRVKLSGTTTVYLKILSTYVGGTPTAWGKLCARRRR